ncbi:MAG: sulfatase [Planctomycetota bacterium]
MRMLPDRHLGPAGAATLLELAVLLGALLTSCADSRPSILLITIDTLRADHTSVYGHTAHLTPALAELASRGTLFQWAFSASCTTVPSHASILTGLYPSFHTVGSNNAHYQLHPSAITLAELLSEAGYETAAIVSNPALSARVGLDQGFSHYDEKMEHREPTRGTREQVADRAVDKAIAWLAQSRDRPCFLWLHLQDPHGPYLPPEAWREVAERGTTRSSLVLAPGRDNAGFKSIPRYQVHAGERTVGEYAQRYDGEIAFTDHHLARLFDHLERSPDLSETFIALTADHGEAFGEDGFFFAHGQSVGLDQVRVPLLLAGPGVPAGMRIETPVSNVALFTTILDVAGLDSPGQAVGPSLLELARGECPAPDPVFVESINQIGVIFDNTFIRSDRLATHEAGFWRTPNPNTGGPWRALGRERLSPLSSTLPAPAIDPGLLEKRLGEFDTRAAEAEQRNRLIRQPVPLSSEQQEALRRLGYTR